MARLIAFTGPKTCGKDTASKGLLECNAHHQPDREHRFFKRLPLASGIKTICAAAFGWGEKDMDDPLFKETELNIWPGIEPRWAMMDIANWFRDKYGEDVWVHMHRRAVEKCEQWDKYGAYIITDMRFPNEYEYLRENNGLLIYVERDEAEESLARAVAAGDPKALNPSEAHYAFLRKHSDIILDNNGTIARAHAQACEAVKEHFGYWGHWR